MNKHLDILKQIFIWYWEKKLTMNIKWKNILPQTKQGYIQIYINHYLKYD